MSAQDEHDYLMAQRKPQLTGSKKRLEASLRAKNTSSGALSQPELQDPIAAAMKNNPGLTREKAMDIAEKLGFL